MRADAIWMKKASSVQGSKRVRMRELLSVFLTEFQRPIGLHTGGNAALFFLFLFWPFFWLKRGGNAAFFFRSAWGASLTITKGKMLPVFRFLCFDFSTQILYIFRFLCFEFSTLIFIFVRVRVSKRVRMRELLSVFFTEFQRPIGLRTGGNAVLFFFSFLAVFLIKRGGNAAFFFRSAWGSNLTIHKGKMLPVFRFLVFWFFDSNFQFSDFCVFNFRL